ncbi:hypothetical protein [Tamlana crocina]|uniref:Uncharacterized protein n=1 Tax=Tamlana crocina TaxID=393006 RepID=A0ABX1DCP7_9FLAO|nr:hypothetical protein [Tamlana crocina]NJX14849.1 hypothetical protein [Tamlana crocina]
MTKITTIASCGNSPKQEFLRDINIAFAQGHSKILIESATDDIVWEIVGDKPLKA